MTLSCLCALCSLVPLRAADPVPAGESEEGTLLAAKITDITVYADRAQVTRSAPVTLGAIPARYAFAKLPGWIDEGAVRVGLTPADAGEILDVQIRRTYLAKASDEEFRKAESAVQEISDQIAALDDEKNVLEAQARQIDAIRLFSLDKLPKDAAVREVKPGEYEATVEFVTGGLRKIAAAKRELEKKRRDLQPELQARQRRLEELRQRSQLEQRTVIVTATGRGNAAATLTLTCLLPGATWEPLHELRTALDAKTISLASFATVMQTTGEDWPPVALALSSQRSTETMKIPELESLLLGAGRRLARVATVPADSFTLAHKNFGIQNTLWFDIHNPDSASQREYRDNQKLLLSNAQRVERLFDTLQQRGTTAHFPALSRQTLRSDGRPVRVPIGQAELAAQHRILAAPELSLNAARIVELSNTGKQALLPGKVALFLDGAFLGLTETDFVAPGEPFSLYLGVADQIKLARTLDKKHSEMKRGGQRTKVQAAFQVTVENLSERATTVQLTERIPVSETDEVRVSGVKIAPEGKPDAKGLLKWDVNLGPKQTREFRMEYNIEYPNDLPSRKFDAETMAAPAARQLQEHIIKLERRF